MYRISKRFFDILLSVVMLIPVTPIMAITALVIKLDSAGPILFKQQRVGKNGKDFTILKFRTMIVNAEKMGTGLDSFANDNRVTKVGKFLRNTSLDELPQLFNILKGDMSFIGPRPWIPEYYEWFTDEQKRRNNVLPGISGLAQVKGRNGISIFKKIDYDLEYVEKISFRFDVKIVWLTIVTVFKKDNAEISEQGIKEEISDLSKQEKITRAV